MIFWLRLSERFASDPLSIETEHNFKYNEQMIFTEEDKFYSDTKKIVIYVLNHERIK